MRIAICLSGQPRNFRLGYDHFNKSLEKYHPDYFLHHWFDPKDSGGYFNIYSNGVENSIASFIEKDTDKKMVEIFNPVKYIFEPQIDFGTREFKNKKTKSPSWTVLSNWYSRKKSIELLKNSGQEYDFVIWSRSDFAILNSFDPFEEIENCDDYSVAYVDGNEWNNTHINTALLISSQENMFYFSNLYDEYEKYLDNGIAFCDHRLTYAHLSKINKKFKQILKNNWMWIRNGKLSKS